MAEKFKIKSKLEKWDNNVVFHGESFNSFFRARRLTKRRTQKNNIVFKFGKIECWIKVAMLVHSFYMSKENQKNDKKFYMTGNTIKERLNEYGNRYDRSTIYKAINTCKELGLFSISTINDETSEALDYRQIEIKSDVMNKVLNIYSLNDEYILNLEKQNMHHARLIRKLVKKRPYSYTKDIDSKYDNYSKEERKRYRNSTEMFVYWTQKVSSRYYYSNKITQKFIPGSLDSRKEKIKESYIAKASPYDTIHEEDIASIELYGTLPDYTYTGWYVPEELRARASTIFDITAKGYITDLKKPKVKYAAAGFETL